MRRVLAMECPPFFGTMPDCDCPWEHWHIGNAGCCLDVHFEEDRSVHVILQAGDLEHETTLHGVPDLGRARELAFAWAAPLIGEVVHV